MEVLLDTGVLTGLLTERRKYRPLQLELWRRLEGLDALICPIVKAEFMLWANRLGDRRGKIAREFIDSFPSLPITDRTAECYANSIWLASDTIGVNDRWIGSVMMDHSGIRLFTLDSDFLKPAHLKKRVMRVNQNDFMK